MRIFFARHGESQANITHTISNRNLPHSLTQMGIEQVNRLAERLEGESIKQIFTSPVLRVVETAEIVAKRLGLSYSATDGLREYDCGILEGRSDEAAWQEWQANFNAWFIEKRFDELIEGGESYWEVRKRFVQFIDQVIQTNASGDDGILCISHGGIYSLFLPLVVRNITPALMKQYGFRYASCIVTENTAEGLKCIEWDGHAIEEG